MNVTANVGQRLEIDAFLTASPSILTEADRTDNNKYYILLLIIMYK